MPEYLVGHYDATLVALSCGVAAVAAYCAADLVWRVREFAGWRRWLWLAAGAGAVGLGLWTMQLTGLRALQLPIAVGYQASAMALSLLAATLFSALALFTASRDRVPLGALVIGSVLMGLMLCVMHHTGMAAARMTPGMEYAPLPFLASVALALFSSAAMLAALHGLLRAPAAMRGATRVAAALVMGLSLAATHFCGMAAARLPVGSVSLGAGSVTDSWAALPVAALAVAVALLAMRLAEHEGRLQRRAAAGRRQRAEEQLERYVAFHDPVTGLPNRNQFKHEIAGFIGRGARLGRPFDLYDCVFQLPEMHDSAGLDRVVCVLAERLRAVLRRGDLLVRLDRMQFVLLRDRAAAADAPMALRAKLLEIGRAPVQLDHDLIVPKLRIGLAEYPRDGSNSRKLLLAAAREAEPAARLVRPAERDPRSEPPAEARPPQLGLRDYAA